MFTPFATNLAQGKGALPLPFSTGCRVCWSVTGSAFVTFVSPPVCHFVHFVRSIASRFRSIGHPLQRAPAPQRPVGTRGGQGLDTEPATQPRHRVDRRGQEEDKRRTGPWHRAQPRSPATELTEFRGAKRRTTGGQGLDTEPGAAKRRTRGAGARPRGGQSSGARPRGGQEEDKAQPQSPATELTEFRGAAKRRTRPSHR